MKISIIIPSLRSKNLAEFLWAVYTNTEQIEYEVAVISTAPCWLATKSNCGHFIDKMKIKWIPEMIPNGTVRPNNAGFRETTGEWVAVFADEMRVTEGWAENMLGRMEREPEENVGSFKFEPDYPWYYYGKLFAPVPFIRRSFVKKLGKFMDKNYNAFYADPDLSLRVYESGGTIIPVNDAVIIFPNVHDKLHHKNVSRYLEKDRAYFKQRWAHLGEFKDPE